MALAQKMESYNRATDGNTARALPREDRGVRPETKTAARPRKISRGAIAVGLAGWACVMAFSMTLVHRTAQVQQETAAITQARADLAGVEVSNRELANQLETQVSVGKVQQWADAHQMKRPTVVNKLTLDPTAVASRPEQAPAQAPPVAANSGMWSTLKGYFASLGAAPDKTAAR
jgi:hypothetical protein